MGFPRPQGVGGGGGGQSRCHCRGGDDNDLHGGLIVNINELLTEKPYDVWKIANV